MVQIDEKGGVAVTTEDTTINEAEFDLWRKAPYLTIDEAMNLIMGFKPGTYKFDYADERNMPDGSVPIYRALIKAIREFKLCMYFYEMKITDEAALIHLNQIFQENIVSYDEYLYSAWWHKGKVFTEDLIKWLAEKNIQSKFSSEAQILAVITTQENSKVPSNGQPLPKRQYRPRCELTVKEAADILIRETGKGSISTIRRLDEKPRDGYPGRYSTVEFTKWVKTDHEKRNTKRAIMGARNAMPTDPQKLKGKSAFDDE